jgi:hypothetical protein
VLEQTVECQQAKYSLSKTSTTEQANPSMPETMATTASRLLTEQLNEE